MRHILVLAIAVGCTVGEEAEPHDDDILDLDNALLVSSRTQLEICVQAAPQLAAQAAQYASQLTADLAILRAHHPDWLPAGLAEFAVHVGCPASFVVDRPI